jgi:hypothetical protein
VPGVSVRGSAVVLVSAGAGAGDRELCGAVVDVGDVGVGQADLNRGNVLAKTVDLAGAGDRDDVRSLGEQPSERDLAGVTPVRAAISLTRSTTGWLAARASEVKRGNRLRMSLAAKDWSLATVPVRKP